MLELIIFAVLAAVVLYQLYAVLGRRVGRQPEDMPSGPPAIRSAVDSDPAAPAAIDPASLGGLAALRARDPSFETGHFLAGAASAYEMIVRAFAQGDRATLGRLLAPAILAVQGTLKSLLQHYSSKALILRCSAFFTDRSI